MDSATLTVSTGRTAVLLRTALVLAFAFAWIAASPAAHAAQVDKSMCDGLKGAAKGVCTAAAALGCGDATKHQKQCDALGDKFEALTGHLAPWETPVGPPPGPSVTMVFDADAFDLETGTLCADALGAPCNQNDTESIRQPNDFWMTIDYGQPNVAILAPVLACDFPWESVGVAIFVGTPFADVTSAMLGTFDFQENVLEAPFGAGDTIVIRTCDLGYFKIGNALIESDRVTISYEQLEFL